MYIHTCLDQVDYSPNLVTFQNCIPREHSNMLQFISPVTRWNSKRRSRKHRDEHHQSPAENYVPTTPSSVEKKNREFEPIITNMPLSTPSTCGSVMSGCSSVASSLMDESHRYRGKTKSVDGTRSADDSKLEAILALRNVIVKQRAKLSEFKQRERQHVQQINRLVTVNNEQDRPTDIDAQSVSVSSHTNASANRKRVVFFGPSFERSDDLSGLTFMEDSTTVPEDIRDLVSSIKEQASQVETAIALDELQSINSEHEALKRRFEKKELEGEAVQQQLDDCYDKVSTLELEKELAQAEATKCKEDLQSCLAHISEQLAAKEDEALEEMKIVDSRRTSRRFFPLRSRRQSNRPATRNGGFQKLNADEGNPSESTGNRLLCLSCKFEEPNDATHGLIQTQVKSAPYSPASTMTAFTGQSSNETDLQHYQSEVFIYYKTEATRLQATVETLKYEHAQRETALVQQVYQREEDNREAKRQYHKQMRLKDILISQLRQQASIACQRQQGTRRLNSALASC
jgi:hypothetical protein